MNLDWMQEGRSSRSLPLLFFRLRTYTLGPRLRWNLITYAQLGTLLENDFVIQTSDSSTDDPSRPLQSGTSDELDRSQSPPRFHRKLAPVAELESSDVVAIGLDRPFSDNVQVNISSSSSRDEGHLNLLVTESEVGTRSSEIKDLQVEQVVVMGVDDPQSAPPDSEVTFKSCTTGRLLSASSDRPDPPPDAAPGSVDVPARPEKNPIRSTLYTNSYTRKKTDRTRREIIKKLNFAYVGA